MFVMTELQRKLLSDSIRQSFKGSDSVVVDSFWSSFLLGFRFWFLICVVFLCVLSSYSAISRWLLCYTCIFPIVCVCLSVFYFSTSLPGLEVIKLK